MIRNEMLIKLFPTLLEGLSLFYLLDCCIIYLFQSMTLPKLALVCLLIACWARYVYRVSILNVIFLAFFQFSYWAITDLLFVSVASLGCT